MTRHTLRKARPRAGVSLTELLCVLAILSILGATYGFAVMRAYVRIMHFIEGLK
ncbi:MAG: prepilin-type N-terminal cleavage/methylation domain-containing protein [Planctomycetaceae bacterium]|nr:prepilin-type N-terminal cleavage/methylation domain-containing protein [Planctomycetaceae bacterium]